MRIYLYKYRYIGAYIPIMKGAYNYMKKPFNLSMDEKLIKDIKHIAINEGTTPSKLFEEYIKAIKSSNGEVIKAIGAINQSKNKKKATSK